ncbi:MAG: hypothetical protein R3B82_24295, partial [Sandaracinaceae bacterium]
MVIAGCGTSPGTPPSSDAGPGAARDAGEERGDAGAPCPGCADDAGPVCGANGCETGEDCDSCAMDCGACDPAPSQDLYGTETGYSCDYYAAPDGAPGASGRDRAHPFRVSDFWGVAEPGDVLCLMDGTYRGADSMIHPPAGEVSGTPGHPIVVAALHDGKAFIDGEGERGPVFLEGNDWMVLEGFDAFHAAEATHGNPEASVAVIEHCHDVIVRRLVVWDSANANSGMITGSYSENVLREDIAAFGQGRSMGGNGHRSDSSTDTSLGTESNNVIRRYWSRLQHNTWGGQKGISIGYNTNGNIVENAIVTMDGYLSKEDSTVSSADHFGIHEDRFTDANNQVLGSIVYRTADQSVMGSDTNGLLTPSGRNTRLRDILVVVEGEESTYGNVLKTGARLNAYHHDEYEAQLMTFFGGAGINLGHRGAPSDIGRLIVQNIDWNVGADPTGAAINPGIALWSPNRSLDAPADYVMAWNNHEHWNVEPPHHAIEDPRLIERFGNLLQFGTAPRPTVDGQPVGAQIACRYENGTLTDRPLWPWPMEERIRVATCMYDEGLSLEACERDRERGVHVTRTVFELGGGRVPDFEA